MAVVSPWHPNTARFIGLKKQGPVTQVPSISTTDPQGWLPQETSPLWAFTLVNSSREPSVRPAREATKTVSLSTPPLPSQLSRLFLLLLCPAPEPGLRETPFLSVLQLLSILSHQLLIIPSNSLPHFSQPCPHGVFLEIRKISRFLSLVCFLSERWEVQAPSSGSSWLTYARLSAHPGRLWLRKQGIRTGEKGQGRKEEARSSEDSLEKKGKEDVRRCLE